MAEQDASELSAAALEESQVCFAGERVKCMLAGDRAELLETFRFSFDALGTFETDLDIYAMVPVKDSSSDSLTEIKDARAEAFEARVRGGDILSLAAKEMARYLTRSDIIELFRAPEPPDEASKLARVFCLKYALEELVERQRKRTDAEEAREFVRALLGSALCFFYFFSNFWQTLRGPFSAVSTPNLASE